MGTGGHSKAQVLTEGPFATVGGMQDAKGGDEQSCCQHPQPPNPVGMCLV